MFRNHYIEVRETYNWAKDGSLHRGRRNLARTLAFRARLAKRRSR